MKTQVCLVTILLFISQLTFAMDIEWINGYIITSNNDTISGQLAYRSDHGDWKECLFKEKNSNKTEVYTPEQVSEYRYDSGLTFIAKQVKLHKVNQMIFVQPLLLGSISLYYLSIEKCTEYPDGYFAYITELQSGAMVDFPDPAKSEKRSITRKRNQAKLNFLFGEYQQIQTEIKKTDVDRDQWIYFFKQLNEIICNDYSCIIFQEKPVKARWFLTPDITLNYNKINEFNNGLFPGIGITVSRSLDKFNDKNILNMGLEIALNQLKRESNYPRTLLELNTIRITNLYSYEYRFMSPKAIWLLELGLYHGLQFTTKGKRMKDDDFSYNAYYMGFLAGTGVAFKLNHNKHQLPVKLQYRNPLISPRTAYMALHISTVELSVGYTFKL